MNAGNFLSGSRSILMQAMLFLVLEESEKSGGYVNAKEKGVA